MKPALNILLAEDNPDAIFLLSQAFRKAEWAPSFHSVCDGVEAIAYLEGSGVFEDREAHPFPDLMLLDLSMPRRNGFEVLEWIRRESAFPGLVVHVLSASARPADVRRAYELNANSYVVKPTSMKELVTFVLALRAWHEHVVFPPVSAERNQEPVLPGHRSPVSHHESG